MGDLVAEDALPQNFIIMRKLGRRLFTVFRQLSFQLVFNLLYQVITFELLVLAGIQRVGKLGANFFLQPVVVSFIKRHGRDVAFLFSGTASQVNNSGTDFLDLLVGKLNCLNYGFFRDFPRPGLDHHDAFRGAHYHDVEQALAGFSVSGVYQKLVLDIADAYRADWSEKRNI